MYEHYIHKLPHTLSGVAFGAFQYRLMNKKGFDTFKKVRNFCWTL